jgi:hypothetical protein
MTTQVRERPKGLIEVSNCHSYRLKYLYKVLEKCSEEYQSCATCHVVNECTQQNGTGDANFGIR